MGQASSRPNQTLSRNGSIRSSVSSKMRGTKKKNLSAAFHVQEPDINWELLNINTATEEELMTLSGINRTVAHNIVEYRQAIGGFKKVEDLALVSGVGATKLEVFRPEVTVTYKKRVASNNSFMNYGNETSRCSSQNQSMESLPTSETGSTYTRQSFRPSSNKIVNVNCGNVFQLMAIRGVNQELAANIVDYRERKGPFVTVNDLLKVKGMSLAKLSAIRSNLVVEKPSPGQLSKLTDEQNGKQNASGMSSHNSFCFGSLKKTPSSHRRTRSVPPGSSSPKGAESLLKEVYGILLRQSVRPIVEDVFNNTRNGKLAIRLASWNFGEFSLDKSQNPGVQEVICRTILENGLSLIVVHEIYCKEALNMIVSELNKPTLPKTMSWEGDCGKWQASIPSMFNNNVDVTTEKPKNVFSGFLFESSHGLKMTDSSILTLPLTETETLTNNILLGWFRMKTSEFMVVSCMFKKVSQSHPEALAKIVKEKFPMETNIVMIEVLAQSCNKMEGFKPSSCDGFKEVVPQSTSTVLNSKIQCTRIWVSENLEKILTGFWGVVRDGLHHLAIPNGWTWGGPVSKSCPVWLEMFIKLDSTPLTNGLQPNVANGIPSRNPSSNNL